MKCSRMEHMSLLISAGGSDGLKKKEKDERGKLECWSLEAHGAQSDGVVFSLDKIMLDFPR
jgi:hypothetical protein